MLDNVKTGDEFQVIKDIVITSNTGVSITIQKGIRLMVLKVYDGLVHKSIRFYEKSSSIDIDLPESFFDYIYKLRRLT